jgi:hypothetical protein
LDEVEPMLDARRCADIGVTVGFASSCGSDHGLP